MSWTKALAAAPPPPAENGAERSGLGGDRDDAAGPRSGGAGRPCVKHQDSRPGKGSAGSEVVGTRRTASEPWGVF